MVGTRSEKNKDQSVNNNENVGSDGSGNNIEDILRPLRDGIQGINNILDTIEEKFEKKFKNQQTQIDNLLTRVRLLEKKAEFNHYLAKLNERKNDDNEQFSKKINLRIEGLPVEDNESPTTLMSKIQENISELELDIPQNHYDKCHRDGPRKFYGGKTHQSILLKMCYWKDRDAIYVNRKRLNFKVYPHLTARRSDILDFAVSHAKSCDASFTRNIDFVFVDRNCKLKVRTKTGKFYGFNSKNEFLTLVSWIAKNEAFKDFDKGFDFYKSEPGEKIDDDLEDKCLHCKQCCVFKYVLFSM